MKHFLSINDLSRDEARFLLAEADRLKDELKSKRAAQCEYLAGKTLAMIFEKPSLRTRASFDIGMAHLGGHPLYLSPAEIGLGKRESVADVARVVSRMADGIVARVFSHGALEELAEYSRVPVINALSDSEHPCQALADLQTFAEYKGLPDENLKRRKIAYVGDGNNVCHSLMLLCAKLGVEFSVATPKNYEPQHEFVEAAQREGEVFLTNDVQAAVQNADAVYTDVWTSMGQEEEGAQRLKDFAGFQVNAELMAGAKPDAIILHCLPAHRGEEISAEVLESPHSKVFEQAENRLHAQKAVLLWLLS
jgi:ornithine carbamoyltransferase